MTKREQNMLWVKTRRCLRAIPRIWFARFFEPIFNAGQILTFIAACIGLYLILLSKPTDAERDALASQWAIGTEAFGIALLGWAVISLICAPFIARAKDRALGRWHGNRFVFFEPYLIGMFRCRATGQIEMYRFTVPFVEPGSYIQHSLELDPDVRQRASWSFGGSMHTGVMPATQWPGTGGVSLSADREATLKLQLEPATISVTARIYCHSFTTGEPSDTDGEAGNYQYPVRPTPNSNAGGGGP